MSDNERPKRGRSRRAVLAGVASGAAALAGCGTGSGSDEDIADSTTVFGHILPYITEQAQLNPWANNYASQFAPILFEDLSLRTPEGHVLGDVVEAIERDGAAVEVQLAEDYAWWNGDAVTARDVWVADRIDDYLGNRVRGQATVAGERTVRYEFEQPLAREILLASRLSGMIDAPRWRFEPWRQRLADATTEDELDDVAGALRSDQVTLGEALETGYGCGPYELTEVSVNRVLLGVNDDHPHASELSVPRLWFAVAQNQRADQLVGQGYIDGGSGVLGERAVNVPEHIEQLTEFPTASGTKLVLNWRNPHLARRNVRRALLCALPLDVIVGNAGWGNPATRQTGMTGPPSERWLPDSFRESLHSYASGDRERAAEFMREAGYAREGGWWVGPDGERASFRLLSPLWPDWLSATRTISGALTEFGFDVSFDQIPDSSFISVAQDGAFGVVPWWTGGYPHAAYDPTSSSFESLGYGVQGEREDPFLGKPLTPTIPSEPGSLDATDGETFDVLDTWERIRAPTSESETTAAAERFARWWNYDLPDIGIATGVTGVWGNVRDFRWPAAEDEGYRTYGPASNPEYRLLKTGAIRPADAE